jgi:hypothetical protein
MQSFKLMGLNAGTNVVPVNKMNRYPPISLMSGEWNEKNIMG